MNHEEFIEINPDILVGKPVIRGTRISVAFILDRFADGWSMDDVLESYPHLSREQVLGALRFAAEIYKEDQFYPLSKASA